MACNCGAPARPAGVVVEQVQAGVSTDPLDDTNSTLFTWLASVEGMTYYIALSGYRYRVWETGQSVRVANVDIQEFQRLGYIQ